MTSTSNILVPLDGSELAEEALDVAVDIARPAGGSITLFAAFDPAVAQGLAAYADAEQITGAMAAEAYLDQVAARLVGTGVDFAKTSSDGSNAAEEIIDRAAAEDVSMIVMTSHGRSGVGRWLLGSVADKVTRSATVPVVIVPCRARG